MKLSYAKTDFQEEFTELINGYAVNPYRLLNQKDAILAYTPARVLYEINNAYTKMCFENRETASLEEPMLSATSRNDARTLIAVISDISSIMANKYGPEFYKMFNEKLEDNAVRFEDNLIADFVYPAIVSMFCSQLLMPIMITENKLINKD